MKKKLLEFVRCLVCGAESFTLENFVPVTEAGETDACCEGAIKCASCGTVYPVIDGIPRFLTGKFYDNLVARKKDFFARYGLLKDSELAKIKDNTDLVLKKKTQSSFGFQWQLFGEMDEASYRKHFLSFIDPPVRPDFFKGKTGVDAGCGFGRHLYFAVKWGATMVGCDLSDALYPAHANTKDMKNAFLLQADIYNLPLRNIFDFVYSLGVLHHLPEPERGFGAIARFAKPGGSVFVWVYSKNAPEVNFLVETMRKLFTALPHRILYLLCFCITVIEWYFVLLPYKFISKIGFIKKLIDRLVPHHIIMYSGYPFRMNFADWQDRLSAPKRWYFSGLDMKNWFEKQELKNIIISKTERYGYRAFGEVKSK